MFEAVLKEGVVLKKVVEAVKDLVNEANMDVQEAGVNMQAMDNSHVSLFTLTLRKDGFEDYRCDRNLTLGLNLENLGKVLKCSSDSDKISVSADDSAENLNLIFEAQGNERICDFNLKLMDIDSETLAIPEEEYSACVTLPSGEFQRIMRDLAVLGDSCTITISKKDGEEGSVTFSAEGEVGKGSITIKQGSLVEGSVKPEMIVEEEVPNIKKEREKKEKQEQRKAELESKKVKNEIQCSEPVVSTFALRYLNMFTKATSLSNKVKLHMSPEVPIVVEYPIESYGSIAYYLAPKIEEDN